MSKQPTDREASNPSLPFPAPPGFGEPIAYLIVAVNAQRSLADAALGPWPVMRGGQG
jgi:hypothetical protein